MRSRARTVDESEVWVDATGGEQFVFDRAQILAAVERAGCHFDIDPSTLRVIVLTPFRFTLPLFCELPAECVAVVVRSHPRLVERRHVVDSAEYVLADLIEALGVPADDASVDA